MKNYLQSILIVFCFLVSQSTVHTQCLLPLSNDNFNIMLSERVLGQSFLSTCTGNLTFITVQSNSFLTSIPNVTLNLWEFDLINGWTIYYTQNNVTLNGQATPTAIEITGSGDISVGSSYIFTLHHASIDLDLHAQSAGLFLTGQAVDGNLDPTDFLGLNDLVFEIESLSSLPVELASFEASVKNNQVLLEWSTKSESNNLGFEIEKSFDGSDWENIGFLRGSDNSSELLFYDFKDKTPNPGKNYYRLKQVDYDGSFEYSPVSVANLAYIEDAKIYPNPAINQVTIYIPELYQRRKIRVFDIHGKQVLETEKMEQFNVQLNVADLSDGIYTVKSDKIPLGRFIKKRL